MRESDELLTASLLARPTLRQHQVSVDPSQPATAFKAAIHQKTGVPPERQKVMVKGEFAALIRLNTFG